MQIRPSESPTAHAAWPINPLPDGDRPEHVHHGRRGHDGAQRHDGGQRRDGAHRTGGAERLERALAQILAGPTAPGAPTGVPAGDAPSPSTTASPASAARAEDTEARPVAPSDVEGTQPTAWRALVAEFVDALYGALRDPDGTRSDAHPHRHDHAPRGHAYGPHDDHGWRGRGHGSLAMRLDTLADALSRLTDTPPARDTPPSAPVPATEPPAQTLQPGADGPEVSTLPPTSDPVGVAAPTAAIPSAAPTTLERLRDAFTALLDAARPGDAFAAAGSPDALSTLLHTMADALRPPGHHDDPRPATGQLVDLMA